MGWSSTRPSVHVVAESAIPAPVELHRPEPRESLPLRLDHAAVALRHPGVRERFRVASRSIAAFRAALDARGFTEIQTPKIVASATEGGANVFRLDYFGRDAYLAQSPQFSQADHGGRLRACLPERSSSVVSLDALADPGRPTAAVIEPLR